MDFKKIIDFLIEKWIFLLIILGIFLILWLPISKNNYGLKETNKPKWNAEVFIEAPSKNLDVISPIGDYTAKIPTVESPKNTVSKSKETLYEKEERLARNKYLIMEEVVRIEPRTSNTSHYVYVDSPKYPSLNYILADLENTIGREELYNEVQRGVSYVLQYARNKAGE